RCVDIHRKPGYDPVELFIDPKLKIPSFRIGWRLLQKKLGFRMLMDVISLDATLVKGSHGTRPRVPQGYPILISHQPDIVASDVLDPTSVCEIIKRQMLGASR